MKIYFLNYPKHILIETILLHKETNSCQHVRTLGSKPRFDEEFSILHHIFIFFKYDEDLH
jgi:hypothetical protein